jgi:hypothetical protein
VPAEALGTERLTDEELVQPPGLSAPPDACKERPCGAGSTTGGPVIQTRYPSAPTMAAMRMKAVRAM